MKGSIVCDELIFPIVDIYLEGGFCVFVGEVTGKLPAVDTVGFRIFDRRGELAYTSKTVLRFSSAPTLSVTEFVVSIKIEWAGGRQIARSEA